MALIKTSILIGPWAQRTPYAPARNAYNLFHFVTEINPNMVNSEFKMALIKTSILIGPWAQRTPYAPARNAYNLFHFVTEINPNMKSGCHHHQIGMYYLYDAII